MNLFKNNGLSQVYTFQYGDACNAPTNIVGEAPGPSRIALRWNAGLNETAYKVRYRPSSPSPPERGAGGEVWYTDNIFLTDHEIKSLQPNTRYEYQIASTCGTFESTWSTVASITTPDVEGIAYSCGLPMAPFNLDPSQLIDVIKVGDVIRAGDFDVKISKVTGSAGTFSGEGVIEVSYFNKAKVKAEFANIVVNKELRMVNGFMNVTGAGVEIIPAGVMDFMDKLDETLAQVDSLLNEYEANLPQQFDPASFVADTAIRVNGTITNVFKDGSGSVVIVDANGNRTTVPAGTSAAVTDSAGNGYIVDKKGNIHKTTAEIAAKAGNREYNLALKFDASPSQAFGYDVKHDPLAVKYERLEGDKYASWKSVATGRTDAVLAILEGSGFDKSKIRFEQAGVGIPNASMPNATTTPMPNAFELNVRGTADGIEEGLLALYTPPDTTKKEQVLGKLNVATYDEIQKTVVIVPVNGNKYPYSEANLLTQLNKIYGQAVVKWNVQMAPDGFVVPGIDPFDDGGSGLLSNYSPDMRKVVDAYNTDPAPDTYYLFLVKNPKAGKLAGYMPRGKEFGFIFTDQAGSEQAIIHTMAHELGHGAFNLRHTFAEEKYTIPQGSTDNLMDYTTTFGTKLYKHQWDQMRYPEIVMGLFEGDSDAASRSGASDAEEVERILAEIRCACINTVEPNVRFLANVGSSVETWSVSDFRLLNGQIVKDLEIITRNRLGTPLSSDYIVFNPKQPVQIIENTQIGHRWTLNFQEKDAGVVRFTSDNREDLEKIVNYINSPSGEFEKQIDTKITEFETEIAKPSPDLEKLKSIVFSIRCGFEKLRSADSRFYILDGISKEFWIDALDETVVIDLLRTTTDEKQAKDLIDKLTSNVSVLETFDGGSIPGRGINDEEYDEYYQELTNLFYRANRGSVSNLVDRFFSEVEAKRKGLLDNEFKTIQELAQRRLLIWSNPGLIKFIAETDLSYVDYEDVEFKNGKLSFSVDHVRWFGKDYDFSIEDYAPFEPIAIFFITNSDDLYNSRSGSTVTMKGEFLLMPAVGLFVANSAENRNTLYRTIDAASFVIPTGLGVRASRLGFVALESALFATQTVLDDYAIELNTTPEGRAVLRTWMVVSILYAVADMTGGVDDLRKAIKNLKVNISKLPTSASKNVAVTKVEEIEKALQATPSVEGIPVPAGLVAKLTQQGSSKLKSWLSSKTLSYADNTGAKFSGVDAETKLFNDLDVSIGNKKIIETVEDSQGRLLIRTDATAPGETKVISFEITASGDYRLMEYKVVYSKGGQDGYPKLSANKLAPDFSDNINECLHPSVIGKKIEISITGQMNSTTTKVGDVELANQAAGISGKNTPAGYTWHHLDDFNPNTGKCTMQLVKTTEHQKCVPHTGGVKQWENFSGKSYLRN